MPMDAIQTLQQLRDASIGREYNGSLEGRLIFCGFVEWYPAGLFSTHGVTHQLALSYLESSETLHNGWCKTWVLVGD
jgi:hypothetical protein